MRIAFADFETYWNRKTKHSLTSMHPVEYVMSPDTELQVLTIAVDNGPVDVIVGEDNIQNYCAQVDWSNMLLVAHNGNGFDHMLFAWRLGIRPAMWGDTLAMAAPIYGTTVGGSLKKLADVLKVGEKGSLEATCTEGLYVKDWTPGMLDSIRRYAGQDTALCRALFRKLLPHTSSQELKLIDLTARMLVEPGFDCDLDLLRHALAEEQERKLNALKSIANIVGVSDLDTMQKALMSNPKFAELLPSSTSRCRRKSVPPRDGKPSPCPRPTAPSSPCKSTTTPSLPPPRKPASGPSPPSWSRGSKPSSPWPSSTHTTGCPSPSNTGGPPPGAGPAHSKPINRISRAETPRTPNPQTSCGCASSPPVATRSSWPISVASSCGLTTRFGKSRNPWTCTPMTPKPTCTKPLPPGSTTKSARTSPRTSASLPSCVSQRGRLCSPIRERSR